MKFKDEYNKKNDMNFLSEEFIKSLAKQMADTRKNIHTDKEISGIVKPDRNKSIKYIFFAATAAVIVIFGFAAMQFTNNFNVMTDLPVTKPSVTSDVSEIVTTCTPQRDLSQYSDNQAAVISAIDSLTLTDSPMAENYKKLDYQNLYSIYDDFQYLDDNESFTFSSSLSPYDFSSHKSDVSHSNYHLYYKQSKCIPENLTESDAVQYKRLLDYIDTNVGSDNYFIYDIYSYSLDESVTADPALSSYQQISNYSTECNYCVQIVLKDYINDFLNCNKYDYILEFQIRNDKSKKGTYPSSEKLFDDFNLDSLLTSQYEYFKETQPVADSLCSEFNSQFSNCTINVIDTEIIKNSDFSYNQDYDFYKFNRLFDVPKALYIPNDSTAPSKDPYEFVCDYMYNSSIYPEIITGADLHDSISEMFNYASLMFEPDTSQDDIENQLNDMLPLLERYNVRCICVDILNSGDDFNNAREHKGYLSDKIINSSFREYYTIQEGIITEGWSER